MQILGGKNTIKFERLLYKIFSSREIKYNIFFLLSHNFVNLPLVYHKYKLPHFYCQMIDSFNVFKLESFQGIGDNQRLASSAKCQFAAKRLQIFCLQPD